MSIKNSTGIFKGEPGNPIGPKTSCQAWKILAGQGLSGLREWFPLFRFLPFPQLLSGLDKRNRFQFLPFGEAGSYLTLAMGLPGQVRSISLIHCWLASQ